VTRQVNRLNLPPKTPNITRPHRGGLAPHGSAVAAIGDNCNFSYGQQIIRHRMPDGEGYWKNASKLLSPLEDDAKHRRIHLVRKPRKKTGAHVDACL